MRVDTPSSDAGFASHVADQPPGTPRIAIGIDLAWGEANPTGLARFVEDPDAVEADEAAPWRLTELRTATSVEAITAWLGQAIPEGRQAWVAIDAPLLATNPAGTQRAADAALTVDLRRFRCPLLPVDERHAVRGGALRTWLAEHRGITYRPPRPGSSGGVFETFPTGAQLGLFDLQRPIRYKHGDVASRKEAMRQVQLRLAMLEDAALPMAETSPWRALLREDPYALRGARLKDLEDRIDAVLCGLVAILGWTAPARLRTEGDPEAGFITIPHLPVA